MNVIHPKRCKYFIWPRKNDRQIDYDNLNINQMSLVALPYQYLIHHPCGSSFGI